VSFPDAFPIAELVVPVVTALNVSLPNPELELPVVNDPNEEQPTAVFEPIPVVAVRA
jgi:hypothetical protein